MKNDMKKNLNYIGRGLAVSGGVLGILHIIPNNGIIQISLLGIGVILIIITSKDDY